MAERPWVEAISVALAATLFSAIFNILNDCDETYNYWEPLHFISTWGDGGGFQTWEYSPSFALRSYLYLWLFGWPSFLSFSLGLPNWFAFLSVRILMGTLSIVSTTLLSVTVASYISESDLIRMEGLDVTTKRILFSFLFSLCHYLSPGYFLASTTLLPSGPSSSLTALMLAFWLRRQYFWAVGCVAITGLVVWPFAAILGLPLAVDMIIHKKLNYLVKSSILWALFLIPPLVAVDSFYYGRFVLAPLNIILYNLFPHSKQESGSASQLYGVEPSSFYIKNYILNQNVMCIFALLLSLHTIFRLVLWLLPTKKLLKTCNDKNKTSISQVSFKVCMCLLLWNGIFFLQAHKEERFLFPCYPLIAIASTIFILEFLPVFICKRINISFPIVVLCSFILLMSVSRISTLIRWYSSPMFLVRHLPVVPLQSHKPMLCMGRDWHLFPSRYFLPGGAERWDVGFVQSNFSGQLPGQFVRPAPGSVVSSSTRTDGNHFNSENLEEPDRFIRNETFKCSFMFDRDSPVAEREKLYISDVKTWYSYVNQSINEPTRCVLDLNFLNISSILNCRFLRAFYIPILSEKTKPNVALHILARFGNGFV
ncbi:unnamed protein product [Trichobilharzia szidati]|nr:unnamed protein product [Trichobilharzia szidati]